MAGAGEIDIQAFYPKCLKIEEVTEGENGIIIRLKSKKHGHICPGCGREMEYYHGTYERVVQDLPIFQKNVSLRIKAYEYKCSNEECRVRSFAEDYEGLINRRSRMTCRLEEFLRVLALSTNCEGAAAVCREMGIKTSGDVIIRLLRQMADRPVARCGETVGVDDFAYRKGRTYCTVVCDGETHRPIEVLDGRDGDELKKWLEHNKHVKKITRDRAGGYAKAISEVLPEAMQIADRFHLHQNLLKAVKEALKAELPSKLEIPNEPSEGIYIEKSVAELPEDESAGKKLKNQD